MERQLFAHFAGGGDDHDRLHRRRLSRSGVSDQQNVRSGMADEVLDDGDGDLAQHVVLSDDGLAQLLEDVAGTEGEGRHAARIIGRRSWVVGRGWRCVTYDLRPTTYDLQPNE